MKNSSYWPFWVALFFGALLFLNQAWVPGFFMDSALYSSLAKKMSLGGPLLVPNFTPGTMPHFFEHPPFFLHYLAIVFKILGANYATARLACFLVVTLMAFLIFRFFLKEELGFTGFVSLVILFASFHFVKKARTPLFDLPLALFYTLAMLYSYKTTITDSLKNWTVIGIFFGLACLSKGPPAILIPFALGLTTIAFKQLSWARIRDLIWMSSIGLAIFSLWPMLLWSQGHFAGFEEWYQKQIVGTIFLSRYQKNYDFFAYFRILLTTAPLGILASLFSFHYFIIKKRGSDQEKKLALYFFCWFVGAILPLSIAKFKYSHYMLPVYPAFAALMAIAPAKWLQEKSIKIEKSVALITAIGAIVLLTFPITAKIRRHKEIIDYFTFMNPPIKTIRFRADKLPYLDVATTLSFGYNYETSNLGDDDQFDAVMVNSGEKVDESLFERSRPINSQIDFYIKRNLGIHAP